jgi:hypothetical protein
MDGKVELILDPKDGSVTFLHSDEAMQLASRLGGTPEIARASHVEPVPGTKSWEADLAPVGGPKLGPFPTRQAALAAETTWLQLNRLYCRLCQNEGQNSDQRHVPGSP